MGAGRPKLKPGEKGKYPKQSKRPKRGPVTVYPTNTVINTMSTAPSGALVPDLCTVITVSSVVAAIEKHQGRLTHAARELGVSFHKLNKFIKGKKNVDELKKELTEARLDMAEEAIESLVRQGNLGAIKLVLHSFGSTRGWKSETQQTGTKNEISGGITINYLPGSQASPVKMIENKDIIDADVS